MLKEARIKMFYRKNNFNKEKEILQKEPNKNFGVKKLCKLNNSLERFNNRFEQTEVRIYELEAR